MIAPARDGQHDDSGGATGGCGRATQGMGDRNSRTMLWQSHGTDETEPGIWIGIEGMEGIMGEICRFVAGCFIVIGTMLAVFLGIVATGG